MQAKSDNPRYEFGTYFERGRFQPQSITRLQVLGERPFPGMQVPSFNAVLYSEFNQISLTESYDGLALKWVMQGCERYVVDGQPQHVQPGKYLLLNAGRTVDIDFHNHQTARGACIYFDNSLVRDIYLGLTKSDDYLLGAGPNHAADGGIPGLYEDIFSTRYDALGQYLEGLWQAIERQGSRRCFLPPEFFVEAASLLIRTQLDIRAGINSIRARRSSTREELFKRVRQAREIIDEDYPSDHDLGTLASAASLSEYHFLRTFKSAFKMTPHQYLIRRRLQAAEARLRHSAASVSDIALDCGFADLQSFCRSFRRAYNTSPLQFRKNCH